MGRGDKKTAKGKRFKGSFGNSRPSGPKKAIKPQQRVVLEVKESY